MENNEREPDSFERALQAETMISGPEIKHWIGEEDEDFRKVGHNECIYRFAVLLLQAAVNSPRDILTLLTADKTTTEIEKGYLESFVAVLNKEAATLSPMAKSALVMAEKLEKEHLARVDRVSKMLSKKDLAKATLCYPVTMWNLEKYCWRLLYHMSIDSIADLSQVVSRLSSKYDWIKQAYKRVNLVPLVMLDYNRNYAWDVALGNLLGVPFPSSNQEREQLRKNYKQLKRNYAGALAEVHFGKYEGFQSLPRHEVGEIADELENAGHESMLNEIDHYSKRLKETVFFEQLPVDVPYMIKGLGDKCKKIVIEKSLYSRSGYRPREYVIPKVAYDPREALLADIIDEARESGQTLRKLADREGIPVKELYEFKRRRKYREKKSR